MSFESLGLRAELLRAISDEGYETPTPVQRQAIPLVLEGRDILAGAQTGTGKTAGFALPILQRLAATATGGAASPDPGVPERGAPHRGVPHRGSPHRSSPHAGSVRGGISRGGMPSRPIRALILTPTRELAAQVDLFVKNYGKHLSLTSSAVFGGVGIVPQKTTLRRGVDILVATPGRLLDHLSQKTVDLSRVEILVLDEADRMLDMGFIRDIRKILGVLPRNRQNLLFSATFSDEIRALAGDFLRNPEMIQVSPRNAAAELVAQVVHPVDRGRKRELLSHLIHAGDWKQVLVFTRTKHGANRLAQLLAADGITTLAIHGNKSQGARTQALGDFKRGKVRVLVATDIAARGLDIDQLPHVVNYELPHVAEDYVHRIGRTGRAGSEGTAISLVCVDEHGLLRDIERLLRRALPMEAVGGFEPDPGVRPEPIERGRRAQGGRPQGARPPRGRSEGGRTPGGRSQAARSQGGRSPGGRTPGERTGGGRSPGARSQGTRPQAASDRRHAPRSTGPVGSEGSARVASAAAETHGRGPRKSRPSSRPKRPRSGMR